MQESKQDHRRSKTTIRFVESTGLPSALRQTLFCQFRLNVSPEPNDSLTSNLFTSRRNFLFSALTAWRESRLLLEETFWSSRWGSRTTKTSSTRWESTYKGGGLNGREGRLTVGSEGGGGSVLFSLQLEVDSSEA